MSCVVLHGDATYWPAEHVRHAVHVELPGEGLKVLASQSVQTASDVAVQAAVMTLPAGHDTVHVVQGSQAGAVEARNSEEKQAQFGRIVYKAERVFVGAYYVKVLRSIVYAVVVGRRRG